MKFPMGESGFCEKLLLHKPDTPENALHRESKYKEVDEETKSLADIP